MALNIPIIFPCLIVYRICEQEDDWITFSISINFEAKVSLLQRRTRVDPRPANVTCFVMVFTRENLGYLCSHIIYFVIN